MAVQAVQRQGHHAVPPPVRRRVFPMQGRWVVRSRPTPVRPAEPRITRSYGENPGHTTPVPRSGAVANVRNGREDEDMANIAEEVVKAATDAVAERQAVADIGQPLAAGAYAKAALVAALNMLA